MKRLVLPLVLLLAIAAAVVAAWYVLGRGFPHGGGRVPARGGEMATEVRALPPFTKMAVDGLAEVTLVQGTTESISLEAPAKQMRAVVADVRNGTLHLASGESREWWGFLFGGAQRGIRATVTFRDLGEVKVSGAVKLRADGWKTDNLALGVSGAASLRIAGLETKSLAVAGSGAVKAEIAGRATEQRIAISGAGDYRAANLASENARVSVSGAGKVVVNAAKSLKVSISGAGSVDYLGDPQVTKEVSGAGRVRRRESAFRALPGDA
jgi:hypothetical protein